MKEVEIIVKAVADVMGLMPCEIMCRRRFPEVVDARWMVVRLLSERGFYAHQIASWMEMTSRNVNVILSAIHDRLEDDVKFGRNLETARKEVRKSIS